MLKLKTHGRYDYSAITRRPGVTSRGMTSR